MKKTPLTYLHRECRSKKKRIRLKWAKRKKLAEIRMHNFRIAMSKSIREVYGTPEAIEAMKDAINKPHPFLSLLSKDDSYNGAEIKVPF